MGVKNRLERLENRVLPKKTAYLKVGWEVPGETVEEAWERHLREHPEDKDATHKVISHYFDWDEDHENKKACGETGKEN